MGRPPRSSIIVWAWNEFQPHTLCPKTMLPQLYRGSTLSIHYCLYPQKFRGLGQPGPRTFAVKWQREKSNSYFSIHLPLFRSKISIPFDSNWENYYFSTLFAHWDAPSPPPTQILLCKGEHFHRHSSPSLEMNQLNFPHPCPFLGATLSLAKDW